MSRTLLLIVLVACAGGGLFLLLSKETGGSPGAGAISNEGSGPATPTSVNPVPRLDLVDPERARTVGEPSAQFDGDTTVVFPLRVELNLESQADLPESNEVPRYRAGAVAGIKGVITGRDGQPARGGTVTFLAGPNVGRVLVSDSRGRFGATNLWQGKSLVRVEAGARRTEQPVRLRRLDTTPFSVDFSELADATVHAVVRDSFGKAIEGAEVRIDGVNYYSGLEGDVIANFVTPGRILVRASKEGFATVEQEVAIGRGALVDRDGAIALTLRPSATLNVSITGGVSATRPALVYLFPAGGPGGPGGTTLRDFPWHEYGPIEVVPGRTRKLTGLPADMVNLRVYHPGASSEQTSANKRLVAGKEVAVEVRLVSAPVIRGRVLREGRPVANAIVTLEAPDASFTTAAALDKNPMYAQEIVLPNVPAAYQETVTDEGGSYSVTAYPGLEQGRYLTARTPDGRWNAARLIKSPGADVDLELTEAPAELGALTIELPGRFQGLPVEVQVDGSPREPALLRPGEELVVDELSHGTWQVYATWEGQRVVTRRTVKVGDAPAEVEGTLPEEALRGQTADVRERVLGSR